jgi:L-alanine-DL-glutamate epimerase-like enolase superfamily enzyme
VHGRDVESVLADLGTFRRELAGDSRLRWLGPEKGVIHMAVGAVINSLWDLKAKRAGLPVWRLLADLEPEETRLARVRRREARAAVRRGGRRRVRPDQAQGRGLPRGRPPPSGDRPPDRGPGHANLLLAATFGVPVCPHAGGVGLCELVQHLAMFDYVAVSGSWESRRIEYVDHLHEHFVDPVSISNGRYLAPSRPGFSAEMRPESLQQDRYPDGQVWSEA